MRLLKNLAVAFVALVAATTNIVNAQAQTSASEVKYDFSAITETGDTAEIDMSYVNLADAFGGKPYDVKFKDGEPKATIITGWSLGISGGLNSYMGAQYGIFAKGYFGWSHLSINAEIGENRKDHKEDYKYNEYHFVLTFEVSHCAFAHESGDFLHFCRAGIRFHHLLIEDKSGQKCQDTGDRGDPPQQFDVGCSGSLSYDRFGRNSVDRFLRESAG